jgi:hypothetical protein
MKKATERDNTPHAGDHLKGVAVTTSSCGLFLSLIGTLFVWAGVNAFNCSDIVWKAALTINLSSFTLTWIIYLQFRNTDQLIGKGLIAFLLFFNLFWLFGFAMFYFYFLFAPINSWARAIALISITLTLIYRGILIHLDIKSALKEKPDLFDRIYYNTGASITFNIEAANLLQEARKDRNPFKSFYVYAAMFIAPFTLILNRLLSPIMGDGHGVFAITAFLSVPILQWGVEIFVQTIMTMVYYPIKLRHETGKLVLLKDW